MQSLLKKKKQTATVIQARQPAETLAVKTAARRCTI